MGIEFALAVVFLFGIIYAGLRLLWDDELPNVVG